MTPGGGGDLALISHWANMFQAGTVLTSTLQGSQQVVFNLGDGHVELSAKVGIVGPWPSGGPTKVSAIQRCCFSPLVCKSLRNVHNSIHPPGALS